MRKMMRVVAMLGLVGLVGVCWGPSTAAQGKAHEGATKEIVGDWTGLLSAGGSQLHLVLHVTKSQDGELGATLDSVDQGANGIPVSAIAVKDGKLSMTVAAVGGTYEGVINKDVTEIQGTWTQMQALELTFTRVKKTQAAGKDDGATAAKKPQDAGSKPGATTGQSHVAPSDIDGAWMGTIEAGAMKLRVVFHITNTADGLKATMDSLDQGAKGIPVTSVKREGTSLKIEMKQIDGVYDGNISTDNATIEGTWTQRGASRPLVLTRVKEAAALELKRPQNPVRPLPYREEEVSYNNRAQGDTLANSGTPGTVYGGAADCGIGAAGS
ncbi:MAG: hypothetical protein WB607_09955 [Candidatus Acidiferrum sp.]|jgi:hypothetical protein